MKFPLTNESRKYKGKFTATVVDANGVAIFNVHRIWPPKKPTETVNEWCARSKKITIERAGMLAQAINDKYFLPDKTRNEYLGVAG